MKIRPLSLSYTRWILIDHEWVQVTVSIPDPSTANADKVGHKVANAIRVIIDAMAD